ncbi:MAG TPA: DUF3153 domain-containing protein [Trichocoleus sp.]
MKRRSVEINPTGKQRWLPVLVMGLIAILTSGCFQYNLGIQFDHQTHGRIVQRIELSERAAALAEPAVQSWLDHLEKQVYHLGGQVKRAQSERVDLMVPFNNGTDLVERFNQLFQLPSEQNGTSSALPRIESHLSLEQQNRVFAIRNHLTYDLDLRELPQEPQGLPGVLGQAADWLTLRFTLQVPWGIRSTTPDSLEPQADGFAQTWLLRPGQVNHIDVVFWVPSWIGLGGAAIATLVLLGYFLKYGLRRRPQRANSE